MHLLLEREDVGDAAVDGVAQPRLRLVGDGDGGLGAVGERQVGEELGHVAGAEHLVDGGEVRRALLVAEVGREHAPAHALAPQELARAARRPEPCHLQALSLNLIERSPPAGEINRSIEHGDYISGLACCRVAVSRPS